MLKSYGWVVVVVVVVVAHVILVSALGPNPSFFLFWGTFIQLGGLLGQGPGLGLGPGLDNKSVFPSYLGTFIYLGQTDLGNKSSTKNISAEP